MFYSYDISRPNTKRPVQKGLTTKLREMKEATIEDKVAELERQMDIVLKYLDAHDRLFKAQDEKADTIVNFCKLNKKAIDLKS